MISSRISEMIGRGASPIRAAFNEAERQRAIYGADAVFDLSIGNPGAPLDKTVLHVMEKLSRDMRGHGYMCEAGYEWVREKISASLERRFGTPYRADEIVMTAGAAGALNATLAALLDTGDEVIVIRPFYPPYAAFIKNWGGVPVAADSDLSQTSSLTSILSKKRLRRGRRP